MIHHLCARLLYPDLPDSPCGQPRTCIFDSDFSQQQINYIYQTSNKQKLGNFTIKKTDIQKQNFNNLTSKLFWWGRSQIITFRSTALISQKRRQSWNPLELLMRSGALPVLSSYAFTGKKVNLSPRI